MENELSLSLSLSRFPLFITVCRVFMQHILFMKWIKNDTGATASGCANEGDFRVPFY